MPAEHMNIAAAPLMPVEKNNCVPVFFGCDSRYLPYTGVAVASLLSNAAAATFYDIIILIDAAGFDPSCAALFETWARKNARIRLVPVELDKVAGIHTSDHITSATYIRLFAPSIFEHYSKILYLDSDILVLADLQRLFSECIDDFYLGACADYNTIEWCKRNAVDRDYVEKSIGVRPYDKFFNAGVLLLNLEKMRAENVESRLVSQAAAMTSPRWHDQDILNAVCWRKTKLLPAMWNFHDWMADRSEATFLWAMCSEETRGWIEKSRDDIGILHFLTNCKPWMPNYFGGNFNLYRKYAESSPLASEVFERSRNRTDYALAFLKTIPALLKYRLVTAFSGSHIKRGQYSANRARAKALFQELLAGGEPHE